jgi:hypothetical protein
MKKYGVTQSTIDKLAPYIGLKGEEAKLFLAKRPLYVS